MTTREFPSRDRSVALTIANGQTASSGLDLGGTRLAAIVVPAAFDGTSLSLQSCTTIGGTYSTIRDKAGTVLSYSVTAGDISKVDPLDALGLRFIRLVAGTAQVGDSNFTLLTTPF